MPISKDRVAYFYNTEVGNFYYGPNHPMKPHRLSMTHSLILGYGLHKHLQVFHPRRALPQEFVQFHSDDYVEFLHRITPEHADLYQNQLRKYNMGDDCPVFEGLFDFCQIYSGGTIEGAVRLNNDQCDIAVNWAGGMAHHAKKAEASGFGYINDVVLGVLELLKYHARVLYVDIDVHHGDGVEEAFYCTDRVLTVSFHKYGDSYFPGTGALKDIGEREGRHYAVNVPLRSGIDDISYLSIFRPVITKAMEMYQPGAVVLQCGADSITGDRLGCFNLTLDGHAECVRFMKGFNVPLLVVGGGGYIKQNVARLWALETAVLVDKDLDISPHLPHNDYYEYYRPAYQLRIDPDPLLENLNSKNYLSNIRMQVLENLRALEHAPSVQMQEVPPDTLIPEIDEDEVEPDMRQDGSADWRPDDIPLDHLLYSFDGDSRADAL